MDLEDSVEIGYLVSKIYANPQHLDALFNVADQHGHRDVLEAMWVDTSCAQFLQDQLTNSMSSELVEACGTLLTSTSFCRDWKQIKQMEPSDLPDWYVYACIGCMCSCMCYGNFYNGLLLYL